tara:strand:+ start:27 stop:1796 length:1770 start_codon:yes stop_codon:yes gene_type:complete
MSQLQVDGITNISGDGAPNFPQGLTGTTANFSGNVSVAGTLTYEDVTNIDSTGIVTARTGIDVLAGGIDVNAGGINAVGTITATSYAGDGSGLSGVGGLTAIASTVSGPVVANAPIVLNDDGTVGVITGFVSAISQLTEFNSGNLTESLSSASAGTEGGSHKFVVAVKDGNNNIGKAKVGTVGAGLTSISFGSFVNVNGSGTVGGSQVVLHIPGTNKVAFIFQDQGSGSEGAAVIGEVSGTSITMGTKSNFRSGATAGNISATYDTQRDRILVAYQDHGDSYKGKIAVGTVSGTSITWNPASYEFYDGSCGSTGLAFDTTTNRIIVHFRAQQHSDRPRFKVASTYDDGGYWAVRYESDTGTNLANVPTQNNNRVVAGDGNVIFGYEDQTSGKDISKVHAAGGVGIGTTVVYTLGTAGTIDTGGNNANKVRMVYNSVIKKAVVSYANGNDSDYGYTAVVNLNSSRDVTVTSATRIFSFDASNYNTLAYNAGSNRILFSSRGDGGHGDAVLQGVRSSNVTAENFLGFSKASYANGATAEIQVIGQTNTGQVGLITARKHFLQGDGSLSTSDDGQSIAAGIGLSSNSILIKG